MREIPTITALDIAFGNIKYLPQISEIPEKFAMRSDTFQNKLISKWFFEGLKRSDIDMLIPKPGVDKNKALLAIKAILGSFEPKHEHKEAGAAFLLSEWFEEPKEEPQQTTKEKG